MAQRGAPATSRVEAVLVDMDDTIFDHSLTCRAAISALRGRVGYLRRRSLGELWQEYLQRLTSDSAPAAAVRSVADARRERWRRLAASCGAELTSAEAEELSAAYRASYQRQRRAVAGAPELLARLHRQVKVVVVTNNEVAEQEEKVRFLGIGPWVDGLVISEGVGVAKPDRRIFEAALSVAGVAPDRATMVGDSWTSDVLGAAGAGIRPVWFNRFGLPRPPAPPAEELRSLRPAGAAEQLLLSTARSGGAPASASARVIAPGPLARR